MKEGNLDFASFLRIVFQNSWIVILITLIAVLTSAYISFHVLKPIYEAKVNFLIIVPQTEENPTFTSSNDESIKLVTTYQDVVRSPLVLRTAQLKLGEKGHDIRIDDKNIIVGNSPNSQVFELLVEDPDPNHAVLIANAIARSFDEKIGSLMNLKENNVKVMNQATIKPEPVYPQPLIIIGITFVISLIVSIWITLLIKNVSKKSREMKES